MEKNIQFDLEEINNAKTKNKKGRCLKIFEIAFALLTLIIVAGVFSLPAVFHFSDSTKPTNLTLLQEKLFAIQQTVNHSFNVANDSSSCDSPLLSEGWTNSSVINDTCSAATYSGSICQPFLQAWQSCVTTSTSSNTINIVTMNTEQEETLNTINGILDQYASTFPECRADALPFLCQFSFPLIDCSTGQVYQSSREECIRISTTICSTLWVAAINLGYADNLPTCENLPEANSFPSTSTNQSLANYNVSELECKDDFTVINATCHAKCDQFLQSPNASTIFLLTTEILGACVVIIVSVIAVIFFIKNQLEVLSYPSFLIIFTTCNMFTQAILIIISAIDRGSLYCSAPDVISSFDHPTVYAVISGSIYHYLLMNMVIVWFCHLLLFSTQLLFPKQFNNATKKRLHKYIGLFIVLLCFVTPLIGVSIAFMAPNSHLYRLQRLPPGIPTSSNQLWFYSVILTNSILLACGIWMIVATVWSLLKKECSKYSSGKVSKPGWSLVIYFTVSAIYLILYTAYSSVWTVDYNNLTRTLTEYFLCEALGTGYECSHEFEKHAYPYLEGITALCRVLVPVGVLIVAINSKGIKRSNPCCVPSSIDKVEETKMSATNPAYF